MQKCIFCTKPVHGPLWKHNRKCPTLNAVSSLAIQTPALCSAEKVDFHVSKNDDANEKH